MRQFYQVIFVVCTLYQISEQHSVTSNVCGQQNKNGKKKLKYVFGDALADRTDCIGPLGVQYPKNEIENLVRDLDVSKLKPKIFGRQSRMMEGFDEKKMGVEITRKTLLNAYQNVNELDSFEDSLNRHRREVKTGDDKSKSEMKVNEMCKGESNKTPSRLCKTTFNTTAPMYGVSLTSGDPVTIVQKFPDLLQQVVYETCNTKECDVLQGECVQTYTPYLFLVIPLGPVTLTGQDYVLVESGCSCRPKYSSQRDPDPKSIIPQF